MDGSVSVIFNHIPKFSPLCVGEKVIVKNEGRNLAPIRVRNKEMVYRLLKKKFRPKMIITHVWNEGGNNHIHLKPYNF